MGGGGRRGCGVSAGHPAQRPELAGYSKKVSGHFMTATIAIKQPPLTESDADGAVWKIAFSIARVSTTDGMSERKLIVHARFPK